MIEITCEIIDNEYVCDIDVTVDEWKQMLLRPDVFDDKSKVALKKWYIEPEYSATCSDIGKKYNEHSMSANGIINGFAGRVQKALGRFEVKGVGTIAPGTRFIVVMKSSLDVKSKKWVWTIREELVQAIKELNIFVDDNLPEESYSDNELVAIVGDSYISSNSSPFEYAGITKDKKEAVLIQNKQVYPRNSTISKNALRHANYKCEIDSNHYTFKRRSSELNYTEPHHLVPMSCQCIFDKSLDVEENVISLCCNCHKQIHLGQAFEVMIGKLYEERKDLLKTVGINVTLDELLKLYITDKK